MSTNTASICSNCSHSPVCKNQSMFRQLQIQIDECVRHLDVAGGAIIKPEPSLGRSVDAVERLLMKECGLSVQVSCKHFISIGREEDDY